MTVGLGGGGSSGIQQCTGMNMNSSGGGGGGGAGSGVDRLAAGAKRGLIAGGGAVVGLARGGGGDTEREAVTLLRASSHSASRDSVLHTTVTLTPTPTPPPLSN